MKNKQKIIDLLKQTDYNGTDILENKINNDIVYYCSLHHIREWLVRNYKYYIEIMLFLNDGKPVYDYSIYDLTDLEFPDIQNIPDSMIDSDANYLTETEALEEAIISLLNFMIDG